MTRSYAEIADDDLARLIAEAPLCWIVPHAAPAAAILMPVSFERDSAGRPAALLGHLPRACPAAAALSGEGAASFLFLGPNAYVSPDMAGRRDWAPTWNFASARVEAAVALDAALTRNAVETLVAQLEGAGGWSPAELGSRYEALLARIVGFRAAMTRTEPRFKLGQDESEAVHASIASAFEGTPLGEWMARVAGR